MEYIKIKDILSFQKKSKIKASEGSKIGKYNFYTSSKEQNKFLDYYEYSNEALIIGTGGNANLHHSYGKFSVSTDCLVLESKDKNFLIEFIYRYLLKNIYILENGFRGAGLKHISKEYLENIKIPIISLEKQKMIIKILKNINIFIDKNKQIKNELSFLNKSLFTKYSIGEKESIANLCYIKARIGWQGLTKKEYLSNGEYYLITGVDFKNEKIDFKNCFYVTKERYNQDENIKVKINDILLTKDGTIGKVAIVDKLEKPATLNSGVFVLRPKVNNLNVTYLMHSLISEDFKKFIDDIKIGATVPHLNQAALLKYKLILPPIELQNKFAERIEKITKLSFEIEEAIKEAENLYNSLISKYFD